MDLSQLKLPTSICFIVCLLLGLVIGYLDFNASEVQGAVLLLLLTTSAIGFLHPTGAWRWAILTAIGIPVIHFVAQALQIRQIYPLNNRYAIVLLPQIPAFIGAYAGVLLRKLSRSI